MTCSRCTTITILLFAILAALAPAQREGGRRPDPKDMAARQTFLRQLDQNLEAATAKLGAEAVGDFSAIASRVVRGLDRAEFDKLAAMPIADQVKEIVAIHRRVREEESRRFIARQPPAIRAELEKLDPQQRDARIFAIKASSTLERAISMAAGHELVADDEIQRLRALDPKEQLDESYRLQRAIFMHVHGSELAPAERARLEELDGRDFWRDQAVRRFRIGSGISRDDIVRLRKLDQGERQAILEALKSGAGLESFVARDVIDADTARRWAALDDRERSRLARVLDRLHFSSHEREFLPWDLVRRLPDDLRGEFFRQPADARRAFLEQNLDEKDRLILRQRLDAMARLKPVLDQLDLGQRGLLLGIMPVVARERLLALLPAEAERIDSIMADLDGAGFFEEVAPLKRSVRNQLSDAELQEFAGMTPEGQADFLFKRFPETYDKEASRLLEQGGHEMPAGWKELSGSQKLAQLNRLGLRIWGDRPGGGRFGGERRGRPGRDDHEGRPEDGRGTGPEGEGRRRRFGHRNPASADENPESRASDLK